MMIRFLFLVASIFVLLLPASAQVQEVLIQDIDYPIVKPNAQPAQVAYRNLIPDTLSFSVNEPFIDDFTTAGGSPDSNLWYCPNNKYPLLTKHVAIAPPSIGVATFDGIDASNDSYERDLDFPTGEADELISHYIDLSAYSPGDSVMLSFFLQSKGLADAPEVTDSFRVYFRNPLDFQQVWAIGGNVLPDFQQFIVPLTDASFFHDKFQIRFVSKGSLLGRLDVWHLDYVKLAMNRSVLDSAHNDIALVTSSRSIMSPFTAVPYQQYENGGVFMDTFSVELHNLRNFSIKPNVEVEISDYVNGGFFPSGFNQLEITQLDSFEREYVSFMPFSDQELPAFTAGYAFHAGLPGLSDDNPNNDALVDTFRIDSIFAYDDGEPDAGYGLNGSVSFGQRFELTSADSLVAVWMNFVPTVSCNPLTQNCEYMEDVTFRLNVWKDPHPDSIVYQQVAGMKVRYNEDPRAYSRYELLEPVSLPVGQFWVGLQQIEELPIGIGFDRTYNNNEYVYWDSLGHWVTTRLSGTLMIRPEMQNIVYNPFPPPTSIENQTNKAANIQLYPNPVEGSTLSISLQHELPLLTYRGELVDLQGRVVLTVNEQGNIQHTEVELPPSLANGVYAWVHRLTYIGGESQLVTDKLILNR